MQKVTLTQTERQVDRREGMTEVTETYRVRAELAQGLQKLAEGEMVNGDTGYGICEVEKVGRYWYATWAMETYEEYGLDPEGYEFEEQMAGHILWDLSTVLGNNDIEINWRGLSS